MKTIKVSEATGPVLDWLVAKCEGITEFDRLGIAYVSDPKQPHFNKQFNPSTDWAQGGPIIEREQIDLTFICPGTWRAADTENWFNGPTPLIAAMRCYVTSKLGDTVEVPKELLND